MKIRAGMSGLLFVVVAGCSKETPAISPDDLKSELKMTLSYAAMANLLIGQHAQGSTWVTFDSVQASYLADQLESESTSLSKKAPSTDDPSFPAYTLCLTSLKDLRELATAFRDAPRDERARTNIARWTSQTVPLLYNEEVRIKN